MRSSKLLNYLITCSLFVLLGLTIGSTASAAWQVPQQGPPQGQPEGPVWLQTNSPGTAQTGNTNISGTAISNIGQFTSKVKTALLEALTGGLDIAALNGNVIRFLTGSTEQMRITSDGKVGIGTIAPAEKLDVAGRIKTQTLQITDGASAGKVLTSNASGLASWQPAASALPSGTSGQTLRHNGTNWVANSNLFNNGTNVGIGTANPDPGAKLDIRGNAQIPDPGTRLSFGSNTRQMINLYDTLYGIGVQYWTQYFRTNKNFAWYKGGSHTDTELDPGGGTVQMVIKDGNVGIGTANPGARLDVAGQVKITSGSPGIGKVLTSDASGLASWQIPSSSGTVTSISSGAGLTALPNPITTTGTISLATPVSVTNGGTGANLSLTGGAGQYVKQATLGGVFSVGAIPAADLPTTGPNLPYVLNQSAANQTADFKITGSGTVQNLTAGSSVTAPNMSTSNLSNAGQLTLQTTATAAMVFRTAGTERMRIYENGRVGIGMTPGSLTKVGIGANSTHVWPLFTNTTDGTGRAAGILFHPTIDRDYVHFGSWSNHGLILMTNNIPRVYIDNNGRIGMGGVQPDITSPAYLTVIKTGYDTVPAGNVDTVITVGSSDNSTSGSSIRARGVISAQQSDIGEYVKIKGDISSYEQGDVLVIRDSEGFEKSEQTYDQRVAGIVTTTASFIAGEQDVNFNKNGQATNAAVMALAGQLLAKVSTENGSIEAGDLLTTSSTIGALMKCPTDTSEQKLKCMGAVVGKALEPLGFGKGKIMILLTLQ